MMSPKSSGNTEFECSCGIPVGICKNLNHPMKMDAVVGPFIEGWALGKYSGKLEDQSTKTHTVYGHLKYGKLIHDYKYKSFEMSDSSGELLRKSIMLEINKSVEYFIDGYFPQSRRTFDTVISVPSSRGSTITVQNEVCDYLVKKGFYQARDTVHVKEKGRVATKNIPGLQQRLKSIGARYELGKPNDLLNAKGLLLIDDIYETGATLRSMAQILNKIVPSIPKYFLTIAYVH